MLGNADAARNIFLSPHNDDIAFSLGAWVARHPGGIVLNLFTRSDYLAGVPQPRGSDAATIDEVSALRRREDERFCDRFGLQRLDLELAEPGLHGRGPFDMAGLPNDVAALGPRLLACLEEIFAAGAGRPRLYCPAAIGGHVSHLATRAVVLGSLGWLLERADVLFYEDLPYAASRKGRRAGLVDLRRALEGHRLRRMSWLSGAGKLDTVNLYPSQHRGPVHSLRRFSPHACWPPGRHEAAWRLITAS